MSYFIKIIKLLKDTRIWLVLFLGFCSGFPWSVTGATMTQFLIEQGLSRSAIGIFGIIYTVYAVNFLWAPLVDKFSLSYTKNKRASWITLCLLGQAILVLLLPFLTEYMSFIIIGMAALGITIMSCTQDIAIDAWRIELMRTNEKDQISLAATLSTIGWWTGYSLPAAGSFYATANGFTWSAAFIALGGLYLVLAAGIFILGNVFVDAKAPKTTTKNSGLLENIYQTIVVPFSYFFRRYGKLAIIILLFIVTFKLGEAFLGRMSIKFYNEIGFSKVDIATYSKLVGWGTIVIFSLLAGLIMVKFGLFKGLFIGGIAMAATNLMFAWIAEVGPNVDLFFWTIVVDNFTSAFSTVAFVAFISYLCGRESVATEYAFLASIGNLGRTFLSTASGGIVDYLDGNWTLFFIITSVMVIPSLILLVYIVYKIKLER